MIRLVRILLLALVALAASARAAVPVISTPPTAQRVTVGSAASFRVIASGGGTVTYQWLKAGAPISGASASTHVIPVVALTDAGNYSVVVTNADGPATSAAVPLVVNPSTTLSTTLAANVASVGPAGGLVTLAASIDYTHEAAPTALGLEIELPAGWALVSTDGLNVPEISPVAGATARLEYGYTVFPPSRAQFTVVVSYPAGLAAAQTLQSTARYRFAPVAVAAAPLTLALDLTAPGAPGAPVLSPVGGTVRAQTLNRTNTGLTATASIPAGESGGALAQLWLGTAVIATDVSISPFDTSVAFDLGTSTPAALQAAIASGGLVTVRLVDAAGNASLPGAATTLAVDYVPPTLAISSSVGALLAGQTAALTFRLSEPASDFEAGDVTVTGGAISGFTTVSPTVYTAVFTPAANSTASGTATVALDRFTDPAGNGNTAAPLLTIPIDTTPQSPVITSPASATGTYGAAFSYTVTATRSPLRFTATGLPPGLTLDEAAGTIQGAPRVAGVFTVTIGAVNSTGSGAGALTLTVAKAPLTVTAGSASRVFGSANPVVAVTYAGFLFGDTAAVLNTAPVVTSTATIASPVGAYPLTPGAGVSDRYTFNYVSGTLAVTTTPAVLVLDNLVQTYTGAGLVPLVRSTPPDVTVTFTFDGSATPPINAGTYIVVATASGNYTGSATGTFVITPARQAINLTPLAADTPLKDYTGPVPLAATSTFGLPVTLALAPGSAATLNAQNELVTIAATGLVTIRANQAGSANVLPADEVVLVLDVTKRNQAITFASLADAVFGESARGLSATASSGLFPTFAIVRGPGALQGNVLQFDGAGEVFVKASVIGDGEFNAAPDVVRRVSVGRTFQAITFSALAPVTYGDAPLALNAAASSGLDITYRIVSGPATVVGNLLTTTGAGSVIVRASQLGNSGIAPAPDVDQPLLVQPRPLTVSAVATTRVYGAANPVFGLNYVGFAGADTATALTLPVGATTSAGPASAPGTYEIVLSGGASPNYTLTRVAGVLTITKAPQVISFPAISDQTLGNPAFVVGAVVSSGLAPVYTLISGPATLVGATLTPTGTGVVTVRASQPGDDNHEPAISVEQTFKVRSGATVVGVTSLDPSGAFAAGATLSLQVSFSGPVVVTGTPLLALNAAAGRHANYVSGSGSATLTYSYVVQTGDNTPDLDTTSVAALTIVGATISGATGGPATLDLPAPGTAGSLGAARNLVIDTTAPSITAFGTTATSGTYVRGDVLLITATTSEPVRVGSALTARLTTGAEVTLTAPAAGTQLRGNYTVGTGENTFVLNVASYTIATNGVRDLAGNALVATAVPASANNIVGSAAIAIGARGPTLVITTGQRILRAGETTVVRFELSESATDFGVEDVSVTNGVLSGFSGSGRSYTGTFTPAAGVSGEARIRVEANRFTDAAGNGNTAGELQFAGDILLAWAKAFGASGRDEGTAVVVDAAGSVTTAGTFSGTVDFDPGAGVSNLTAAGGRDLYITKLDAAGNLRWARAMGGAATDEVRALAQDSAGNLILAGSFAGQGDFDPGLSARTLGANGGTDVFLLKLNADGALLWAQALGGAAHEQATSVAVDPAGDIYLGGFFSGTVDFDPGSDFVPLTATGWADAFVAKFSADGALRWAKALPPAAGHAAALTRAVGLDAAGGLYALSASLPLAATFDPALGTAGLEAQSGLATALTKLDATGSVTWTRRWSGADGVLGSSLAVSATGETVIAGTFRGTADFDPGAGATTLTAAGEHDGFLLRLDATGAHRWSKRFGGTAADEVNAVALDATGAVYAVGGFRSTVDLDPGAGIASYTAPQAGEDAFLVKLTPAGDYGWSKVWSGPGDESGRGLAVDAVGEVYATGRFGGTVDFAGTAGPAPLTAAGGTDGFVLRLTIAGAIFLDTQVALVAASERQSPREATVTNTSVAYRVRFTRAVTGVDPADFTLTTTGGLTGVVADVAALSGTDYLVTVHALTGSGTARLDVKAAGTGITDQAAGNALGGGFATGEVFTVQAATTQPVIASAVTAGGTYGSAFSYAITASRTPLSFTATGLPAGLSVNSATGVISGTPREAGVFAVSLGALNVSGQGGGALVLRIAKAPLTVTAANTSRPYGQPNPIFAASYSGFASGDTAAVLTAAPVITTPAGTASPAGVYPLQPDGGTSERYAFTYVGGTLTVTKVPVAIALAQLAQSYTGQGLAPAVTTNVADVALTLTYNGSTTRPVTPGTYAVVATPTDANYTGSATGTLVISRAAQWITIAPLGTNLPLKFASGPVAVTATSNRGLPVTLTLGSGSAATLNSEGQLTAIGATGLITLRATQAGNANTAAAEEVVLVLDVAKVNQGLSFTLQESAVFGTTEIPLSATASSGLPVRFAVIRGPATVTGTTLHVAGAGEILVQASQPGDETHNPAPAVTRVLTVGAITQSIQFAALESATYGDLPRSLTASASSGLAVVYTVVSGPATVAGNVLTLTGAGDVTVRASQPGDGNRLAALDVEQTLLVRPKALTVGVAPATRGYGAANPAFVVTYLGLVNGDTTAALIAPAATTTADATSAPGVYAVTLTGGSAANYTLSRTDGTLTVTKAAQTIAFTAPLNQAVGNAPFTLGAVASSGLAVSYTIVRGPASVAGNVVTLSGAGTVVVRASQAGDAHYEAAPEVEQSFAVAGAIGIAGVTAEVANGAYGAGVTLPIQVGFTGVVTVVGAPELILNTAPARRALYASGSGTGTLTFHYTVQAGDTAAALDYAGVDALTIAGAAIRNAAGTASAVLTLPVPGAAGSLGQNKVLAVDTTAPSLVRLGSPTADGAYKTGAAITVRAVFSETVPAGRTMTVTLDTGAVVTLTSPSAGTELSGVYTVAAGESSADLTVVSYTAGTVRDLAGNALGSTALPVGADNLGGAKALVIATQAPPAPGAPVLTPVGGTVVANTLNRTNTNLTATAAITPGAATGGSARLLLGATVLATDNSIAAGDARVSFDLGTASAAALQAALPSGGSLTVLLRDAALNESLPSSHTTLLTDYLPPAIAISSANNRVDVGATETIAFTLDEPATDFSLGDVTVTGGTLAEFSGSGTAYTAKFAPTPGPGGNASITVAAGTFTDAAGNPNLAATPRVLTLDPAGAVAVTAVTSPMADGAYRAGANVTIDVVFSGVVNVTGAPVLALNTVPARSATYVSGAGTTTLAFTYGVQARDTADDLDSATTAALELNGGAIVNLSGTAATLTLPAPGAVGSLAAAKNLRIDTMAPRIAITSDRMVLKAGETAQLSFALSENANDFTAGDVSVTNGGLSAFAGSGQNYTAIFTPAANVTGVATVRVAAAAFSDAAGNGSVAGELTLANDVRVDWVRTWGASGRDEALATAVDAAGNVYSAGLFSGTVDFDPGAGVHTLTAAGGSEIFVTKLDRQGAFVWARAVGAAGADEARALVVNGAGDLFIAGTFSGTVDFDAGAGTAELTATGGTDAFVLKLNSAGQFGWAKGVGGAGPDEARALAVDAVGQVYVAGSFNGLVDFDSGTGVRSLGANGGNDIFILKLDAAGGFGWAAAIGGAGHEQINALAIDPAGDLYAAGEFSGKVDFDAGSDLHELVAVGGSDAFVAKFDASGALRWARALGGPADDQASSLAVGATGELTVAGSFRGTADFDPGPGTLALTAAGERDGFVVRLDAAGSHGWSKRIGGTVTLDLQSLALDAGGAIYVLGAFRGTADLDPSAGVASHTAREAGEDVLLVKLAANGNYMWSKVWGGAADERGQGVAVDEAGDVYAVGGFGGTVDFETGAGAARATAAGGTDALVVKFTAAGGIGLDTQAPAVAASERQTPREATVTSASVAFRVRFTRAVAGVDASDFALTTSGGLSGAIADVAALSATDYLVVVNALAGSGTVRLDVKAGGTGIADVAGNVLAGGFTAGEIFTVNAATTQPVIASAVTAGGIYGSAFSYPIAASNTPLSYTATGLPAGLSVNGARGVISGTPREAGVFAVSLGALNLSGQGGGVLVLRIAKAVLTVTATNASRPYGQANPIFAVSYGGFAPGDTVATLTELPEVTTTAGTLSAAGVYPLQPVGGASDRYGFSHVAGSLTITKIPVVISFSQLTQSYSGQGLAPGLTTSVPDVAMAVTYNGSTTRPVTPGTYAFVATPADGSYTGSAAGTLTITRAEQRLAFAPLPATPLSARGSDVQIEASSTSGLPVTITLDAGSVATLNAANKLEGIGAAGRVTLRANQGGNTNYHPAAELVLALDVTKQNQSIDFAPLGDVTASTVNVNLRAAASSGLGVSFVVVSGPATVEAATLTLTGVGPIVVKAVQPGSAIFNPAQDVVRSFGVTQLAQSITFPPIAAQTYGAAPVALRATSDSALAVSYAVLRGPGLLNGNLLALTGAGEIVVRATQAGNGLIGAAEPVEQNVVVAPRELVVTALPATRSFAAGNPVFALSYQGFVNGDTADMIDTLPGATTDADATSAPGVYALTPGGGRAANYRFTFVAGTLTITRAAQTLTFPPLPQQALGNLPFTLGAVASSGLAPVYSIVSGPATVADGTVTLTGPGAVVVRASQPGDANYLAAAAVEQGFVVASSIGVIGVTSPTANGAYPAGQHIELDVSFSGIVIVSGTPTLALNVGVGRAATYAAGSGTSTLSFVYTVQAGDNAAELDYTSTLALAGAITSASGSVTPALTLAVPGAAGSLRASRALRIDTLAPVAPTLSVPSPTNLARPTLSGTAEAGTAVEVRAGLTLIANAVATSGGTWSAIGAAGFADGSHVLTARAIDAAGNVSLPSVAVAVVVDTSVPAAPVISASAPVATLRPVVRGTATAGHTVRVFDMTVLLGTAVVAVDGTWSFTPTGDLAPGAHALTATATNAAGTTSARSAEVMLTVDIVAPAAPTIATTGVIAGTNAVVRGTAEAESTVTVFDGAATLGSVKTAANGQWIFTAASNLTHGVRSITAQARDAAGNVGPVSAPVLLTVDAFAPDWPLIETSGVFKTGTPPITGRAEPLVSVRIFDGATVIGTVNVAANGRWTFTPATVLAEGAHSITAVATDAAGNTGGFSTVAVVSIDTVAPAAPVVTPATVGVATPTLSGAAETGSLVRLFVGTTELGSGRAGSGGAWSIKLGVSLTTGDHDVTATATDVAGNVSPLSAVARITFNAEALAAPVFAFVRLERNTATPALSGAGVAGSTITVFDGGNSIGDVVVAANGVWTLTPTTALVDGTHLLTAIASKAAQTSPLSATVELVVDTVRPSTPFFNTSSVRGTATPSFVGQAERGSTLRLSDGPTLLGVLVVPASGRWTFQISTPLIEGDHFLTATTTDAAGNTSEVSAPVLVRVDRTPPAAPVLPTVLLYNIARPSLSGTAESDATVTLSVAGVASGSATAGTDGAWTLQPATPLADGVHTLVFTATDLDGNVSASATLTVRIDSTAPTRPTLTGHAIVNTLRPTVQGTGESGASIVVRRTGVVVATGTVAVAGAWSLALTEDLVEGGNILTSTATDAAGNQSEASLALHLTVDITPPAPPMIATSGTLNTSRPAIAGTAEALVNVRVSDGATVIGTAATSDAGQWSFVPAAPLERGAHSLTAVAIDAAGNVSAASTAAIAIELPTPSEPVIETAGAVNTRRPLIAGTAEAGTEVRVLDGTTLLGTVDTAANGRWSLALTSDLAAGAHTLTATAKDKPSLTTSALSAAVTLTVDLDAPGAPVVVALGVTSQTRPTISGTAEVGLSVTIFDGTTLLGGATATSGGAWNFVPTGVLSDGPHPITAVATDAAGNASAASTPVTLVVDTVAPAAPSIDALASPTNVRQPALSGRAEAGATVRVTEGVTLIGTAVAGVGGVWNLTPVQSLSHGLHTFGAVATDGAGNTSPAAFATVQIDASAPATPTVQALGTTAEAPLLRGTYDASDTALLTVTLDGRTYSSGSSGLVVLDRAQGLWQVAVPLAHALREGTYSVTVVAVDLAGNTATDLTSAELSIGTAVSAPVSAPMPQPASATALRVLVPNANARSLDLTQMFTDPLGRALTFAVMSMEQVTATISGSQLRLVFAAGFATQAVVKLQVIVDPANPAKNPTYAVNLIYDGDSDNISDGIEKIAGDLNGDGQPDSAQNAVASFPLQQSGRGAEAPKSDFMSIVIGDRTPAAPGADGRGVVVDTAAKVTNVSVSPFSEFGSTPTTWAPVTPVIRFAIEGAVPQPDGSVVVVISLPVGVSPPNHIYKYGLEHAGDTVKSFFLFDFDGYTGGSLIDTNGDGRPDLARIVYRDGQRGDDDRLINGVIVDPIVFAGPMTTTGTPAIATLVSPTNVAAPTLTGTSVAGATLKLYDGDTLLGLTTADAVGGWVFTVPVALGDGAHDLRATAIVPPAMVSAPKSLALVIDTQAPAAPTVNAVASTSVTVRLTGTAEPGATVKSYAGAQLLGIAVADTGGVWELLATFAKGSFNVTAVATDPAGNTGPSSAVAVVRVEPIIPPVVGPAVPGGGNPTLPEVVAPVAATVTLSQLNQTFDGTAKTVAVSTTPTGLAVTLTYNGNAAAPSAVGTYAVVANVTSSGFEGGATGALTIGKAAQTIAFTAPAAAIVGTPVFLPASATSGLAVTLTLVSGPAILSGNTLTATAPGAVEVRASQPGNESFHAAADVARSIMITGTAPQIYLGTLQASGGLRPAGDIAAVLPADGRGHLLLVAPDLGINGAFAMVPQADGSFTLTFQADLLPTGATGHVIAAASATLTLQGSVRHGVLTGSIEPVGLRFSVPVAPVNGPGAAVAGFYRGGALGTVPGTLHVIVSAQNQILILAETPTSTVGGPATLAGDGTYSLGVTLPIGAVTVSGSIEASSGAVSAVLVRPGQPEVSFAGVSAAMIRTDRLVNLSSRARAGTGDNTLIAGFVIGGLEPQTVILRAIGPALRAFGVSDAVANPRLRLYRDATIVAENDDWSSAPEAAALSAGFARVGAFALPTGSADAALLVTLPPGAYTLQVSSAAEEGDALAEIYDASSTSVAGASRLVNIATRGGVRAGSALIGGFVVSGNAPKRVLVRAVGPGLSMFGVSGVLANPRLAVFAEARMLAENDDWSLGAAAAEIAAAGREAGAFALTAGSRDAALVLTLLPGAYTAHVSGVGATSGTALVEIYELP